VILLVRALARTDLLGRRRCATLVLDVIANKVIQKYQQSSCEQLWQQKSQKQNQPRWPQEQEALKILHTPTIACRIHQQNSGPVANKMFECGMIP